MNAIARSSRDIDSYLPRVPILTALQTAQLLGYTSTNALAKARQTGRLPIAMFQVPGRRGWFAATSDIRAWLLAIVPDGHAAQAPLKEAC